MPPQNNVPSAPQTQVPTDSKIKDFFPPKIFIILILLAGILGSYQVFYSIKSEEVFEKVDNVEVKNELVAIDTSDWKTYINTKYNFEFKYPDNVGIINEETSEFVGPPINPEEDLLLISDKEKTFHFQVIDGKLNVTKASPISDQILSTFKFIDLSIVGAKGLGDKVGYINRVYIKDSKNFADFDEVEYFRGEEIIVEMKKDGACREGEGYECFNPAGYYIRNKDKKTLTLQISDQAKVLVLSDCYELTNDGISITPQDFVSKFGVRTACEALGKASFYVPDHTPYWIKQDKNDLINSIIEQYIP